MREVKENSAAWTNRWLDSVADGSNAMSQRKLTSVQKRGGGLATVRKLAKAKKVHLLLLVDDQGAELVAASVNPFKVIC